MSPLASQAVLWVALPLAAIGLAVVLGIVHGWLRERPWVKRVNARIAAEYEANPLGGAPMWDGESHLLPPWKVRS